jgi:hypothetical protein
MKTMLMLMVTAGFAAFLMNKAPAKQSEGERKISSIQARWSQLDEAAGFHQAAVTTLSRK